MKFINLCIIFLYDYHPIKNKKQKTHKNETRDTYILRFGDLWGVSILPVLWL